MTDRSLAVTNPYNGDLVGEVSCASVKHVLDAARSAKSYRSELTAFECAEILDKSADSIERRGDEFAYSICVESGLALKDGHKEVSRAIGLLRLCVEEAKRIIGEAIPTDINNHRLRNLAITIREPIGLVCAITPFNRPLNQVVVKLGPAIAANNCVILKPSEKTSLTAIKFVEVLLEYGLPAQMIGVVTGDPMEIGDPLVREPKKFAKGSYKDYRRSDPTPTRAAALERFLSLVPADAAVISTTGKCSRELFQLSDREQHFYQVGSMGCQRDRSRRSLHTGRRVIVLDGDGAALMRLGNFATIGVNAPDRFIHIIFDNGVHDSTGGQQTVSSAVDFALLSSACGYRVAVTCDTLEMFDAAFRMALTERGPHLIHLRISVGSLSDLGRPTLKPYEVARRFRSFLASSQIADG